MVDKCPTCEREFWSLEDYPLIYVASFNRESIPTDLKFPFEDWTLFMGPNSGSSNKRPPTEVLEFFKNDRNAKEFEYNGWRWKLEGKWGDGYYHRGSPDQKEIIFARLNPYLDSLEGLVGREVPKAELLPQFPRNKPISYAFNIPDTGYQLMFDERRKTSAGLRLADLFLMGEGPNLGSAGGPTLNVLAAVGRLEYKGRVRK